MIRKAQCCTALLLKSFAIVCASGAILGLSACGGGGSSSSPGQGGASSYTLSVSGLNPTGVSAGHTAKAAISLTPVNGYTGSVSLSCGAISGGSQAPTCSFSPAKVPIGGVTPGASTLTVSTTVNTPGGGYDISVPQQAA